MKLAVIKTGGKQYKVKEGETLKIEKLPTATTVGQELIFDQVLLLADDAQIEIGAPFLTGAKVRAELISNGRAPKITVLKYKAKTRYRVKRGHRQHYTQVKITKLDSSARS